MRKTLLCGVLCILGIWYTGSTAAQSTSYPNTLLWRISGKDLSRPSYLFGTMHLKDRRLFQFSDSLYRSLESVEGYAMEIDPEEAVSALLQSLNNPDSAHYLYEGIDEEEFGKAAKSLEKKFGVPAKKITRRQAWLYKQGWGADSDSEKDMDAAVDTYLFNIAKRQGKWVGGIEDLEDQLGLLEDTEKGFNIDDINDLIKPQNSEGSLESLIRIYTAQNLNKINDWIRRSDSTEMDRLLTVRNKKMARRIDSLAHIRSCFFAVGAAHLPGEDGVIRLLRANGYSVEPVFGSKKISPEKYTYKTVELPWTEVSNEEKSFTVRMPGKATVFTPFGDVLKMHVHADLGTGLIYFATGVIIGEGRPKDSALLQFAQNYAQAGKQAKPQPVRYKQMEGYEMFNDAGGYHYRVRMFHKGDQIVMAMVGSQKKSLLHLGEAEKFYQSLELSEYTSPKESTAAWLAHLDRQKGFAVDFPGKTFSNKEMDKQFREQDNGNQWSMYNQTYIDISSQTYYMLVYKEPRPGSYLQDDAIMFEEAKTNVVNNSALELVRYDTGRFNGLAAAWIDANYTSDPLYLRSFNVNRGNRCVSLIAVYSKQSGDTAGVNRFFNSLRFLDFESAEWKEYEDENKKFTAKAPGPLQRYEEEEDEDSEQDAGGSYYSYDARSGFSFIIQKQPLSPYYWAPNDSTFFADMLPTYVAYNDSLLSSRKISNAGAPGMEYLIRMQSNGRNTKRVRMFLNKDTVYSLLLIAPLAYQQTIDFDRFFTEFQFKSYEANKELARNKAAKLLADLHSDDSLTFEAAKAYVDQAPFTVRDLPVLHQALLSTYKDFNSYNSVHSKLMSRVIALKDSSTVGFVQRSYRSSELNEELRYPLLNVLASIQTGYSYNAFKSLLQERFPKKGNPSGLSYRLTDSLQLAESLHPQLLSFAADSLFAKVVVHVTNELLDSSRIQLSAVLPFKEKILHQARYWYQQWAGSENDIWQFYSWVKLLGRFNDEACNQMLQQVADGKYPYIKKLAVVELIRNGQSIRPAIMEAIAADDYTRALLYEDLKELNSLKLFPAKYLNQKSIAESELVQYLSENDMEPSQTTFLEEKEALINGKKQKFYLFKVSYAYEEGKEVYLGVCGPYNSTKGEIRSNVDLVTITEEQLNSRNANDLFKQVLNNYREYLPEN